MTRQPRSKPTTSRVAQDFAGAKGSLKDLPLNRAALTRDSAELLSALERVRNYRAFLAKARAAKTADQAPDIDRLVYAQALVVQTDAVTATAASARTLRSLHVVDTFNRLTTSMARSLKASGPIKTNDLWTYVRADTSRPYLERFGISDAMLEEFGDLLARTELFVASDDEAVTVEGLIDGQGVRGRMTVRPAVSSIPRDPIELLTASRFVALCDALERGEPAYLFGTGPPRSPPSLEDLLMNAALAGQRESVRHVRKLEDVGLATYAGGEPSTTLVVILLGIALLGAFIVAVECDEEDEGPLGRPSTACTVGKVLLWLSTAVLIGLAFHDKQTQVNTLGGQSISGPLPQLEEQGA